MNIIPRLIAIAYLAALVVGGSAKAGVYLDEDSAEYLGTGYLGYDKVGGGGIAVLYQKYSLEWSDGPGGAAGTQTLYHFVSMAFGEDIEDLIGYPYYNNLGDFLANDIDYIDVYTAAHGQAPGSYDPLLRWSWIIMPNSTLDSALSELFALVECANPFTVDIITVKAYIGGTTRTVGFFTAYSWGALDENFCGEATALTGIPTSWGGSYANKGLYNRFPNPPHDMDTEVLDDGDELDFHGTSVYYWQFP